jgi:hypothetical protein
LEEVALVYQTDPEIQRALACICYRLLDHVTAEWVVLAPEILGCLLPIVRDLPPGQTISTYYPSFSPDDVPPLLREVYTLRAILRETWQVPTDSANVVLLCVAGVNRAREDYQRSFAAPRADNIAACLRFIAGFLSLYATVIGAERRMMERQARWDSIVRNLRGRSFFCDFSFELGEDETIGELWYGALSEEIRDRR